MAVFKQKKRRKFKISRADFLVSKNLLDKEKNKEEMDYCSVSSIIQLKKFIYPCVEDKFIQKQP